ncbi:hypothetical protein CLOM_g834 [Closterium sp. NIES-68]|nr:hypothetical protein CLOM_g834 [Closterium sp. NIES-68]GJP71296.1 hypothetical protein CLOP_g2141 [Closterium sp. NIES-67]
MREQWFALSERLQMSPFSAVATKLQMHLPLHATLAALFLACHYLRLPLLPTDICHLALAGSLPYLSAWRQLPPFQGYPSSVPPASLFRPLALSSARLLELLAASGAAAIGLALPPVNFRLLGERFLEELHLPLPLFAPFLHRLFDLLCPSPSLPSSPFSSSLLPRFHLAARPSAWPTRLYVMAAVLTSLKLALAIGSWPSLNAAASTPPSCASPAAPHTPAVSASPHTPAVSASPHTPAVSASPHTRSLTGASGHPGSVAAASTAAAPPPSPPAVAAVAAAGGAGVAGAVCSAAAAAPRATVSLARGAVSGWQHMVAQRRAAQGKVQAREGEGRGDEGGMVARDGRGGGEEWDVQRVLKAVEGSRQQLLQLQTQTAAQGGRGRTAGGGADGAAGRAPLLLRHYLDHCQRHLFAPDATRGADTSSLDRELRAHLHAVFHARYPTGGEAHADGDEAAPGRGREGMEGWRREATEIATGGAGGGTEERAREDGGTEGGEEVRGRGEGGKWFPVRVEDVEADMRRCDFVMAPALPQPLRGSEVVYYERPKARMPFLEAHADLFVLLRAAARVARVHVRALHLCMMEVEDALVGVEARLQANNT